MLNERRSLILMTTYENQPSVEEFERWAAAGERSRKDYVELARAIDADVVDDRYMKERASLPARVLARWVSVPAGQVVEGFVRRKRYRHLCAWADRLGLPLALLFRLTRSRRDLVLVSAWLSPREKAVFLRPLRAHTHLGALVNYSRAQMELAAARLGVPEEKLFLNLQPVDERFWRPEPGPVENLICAVGSEQRDYATLVEAARGLDLRVEIAVGNAFQAPGTTTSPVAALARQLAERGLPPNVAVSSNLDQLGLRRLYARSRFAVVPLNDVDYDAGVTAIAEAMAMGKAVVVTRTKGQADLVREGEYALYVPPGDPVALRAALTYLAEHPEEAERMGRAGRALAEEHLTLDRWVARLAAIIRASGATSGGAAA